MGAAVERKRDASHAVLAFVAQTFEHFFRADRQLAQSHAHRIEHRIGDRRRQRDIAHLADRGGRERCRTAAARQKNGFELGYVHDRRQLVVAEMRGNHRAVFQNNPLAHGLADGLDQPALDLSLMGDRVDDGSDIMRGDDTAQAHLPGLAIDRHFGEMCGKARAVARLAGCVLALASSRAPCRVPRPRP